MKIELGTIQWQIEFRGGEMQRGSPRIDVLQDNLKELARHVPDGVYRWKLVLDLEEAEKEDVS